MRSCTEELSRPVPLDAAMCQLPRNATTKQSGQRNVKLRGFSFVFNRSFLENVSTVRRIGVIGVWIFSAIFYKTEGISD